MSIVLKLKIFLFIAVVLLLCEILVTCYLIANDFNKTYPIITGVAAIPSLLVCLVLFDIIRLKPANSHTGKTLLSQYGYSVTCRLFGFLGMKKFKKQSKNCGKLQENLLHHIIEKNKDTEYAKEAGLSKTPIFTVKDFTKSHPVTDYEKFRPYIDSIVQGKSNVLTVDKPEFLAATSGTTGKCKRYPIIKEHTKRIVGGALAMLYTHRDVYKSLKRLWQFRLMSKPTYTEDGIPITGVSNKMAIPYRHNIVPAAITKIFTEYPAFYVQAIFALTEPELFYIDGFSSNLMYSFFKFLEANYTKICHDIATGALNENLDMTKELRDELNALMVPNPTRAAFIKQQIELGSTGLAKRIWPDLEFVHLATSAGMKMCADILRNSYLQGVKLFQMAHGASEAFMGYQLEDDIESEVLTMLPDATAYLEFIPVEDCFADQPKTCPMDQLKIGQQYEVVATTVNGLYRLRFGDIIEVVGHFNSIPKYVLKGRLGQQLNVAYERTPEHLFYDALCAAEKLSNMPRIEEYTTTESMVLENLSGERSAHNYYVTFVEFAAKDPVEKTALNDMAQKLDKCLCECHSSYKFTREKGHLAPVQVIEVKPGTFDKVRYKIWGECQNMQFKMPRVIRRDELLKLLWDSQCKQSDERSVEEITHM